MSFSRLLRKFSQPSFAHSDPTGAGSSPRASADDSDDPPRRRHASESTPPIPRPWRRKRPSTATVDRSSQSQLASSPVSIPKVDSPTSDGGMAEMPLPMPPPTNTGVFLTNLTMVPSPDMIPAIGPVPDTLADAWDAVKENPRNPNMSRELDAVGAFSVPLPLPR